ncbi:flotillin-like protein FloA [Pontiellaceae bacterium B12227]|nr:flotillin-like protein FloA [Pontiellaceae bacterium B12227]
MTYSWPVIIILAAFVLAFLVFVLPVIGLWVRATFSGVKVKVWGDLVGMRLRRVPPSQVVLTYISAAKAGIEMNPSILEAHYLAGGSMQNVVRALIAADKANIDLTFQQAAAIDLAGRNIVDAVQTSVNPKVIDCPGVNSANGMLDAVAKDGIRLLVKARVTVRTNLDRLVGGATEETIIARVGQGIVSAIGSMASYKNVLENPDSISRKVLESGLDAQTAFEIVSIDIADVSVAGVGQIANVGAKLETDRADADKIMRQAEAEGRRAMAIATEQEMRARVQEMQAKVIEAQAEVPLAMAEAFRKGNLGVMDFYRMQNIMADTSMRESLAGGEDETEETGK